MPLGSIIFAFTAAIGWGVTDFAPVLASGKSLVSLKGYESVLDMK